MYTTEPKPAAPVGGYRGAGAGESLAAPESKEEQEYDSEMEALEQKLIEDAKACSKLSEEEMDRYAGHLNYTTGKYIPASIRENKGKFCQALAIVNSFRNGETIPPEIIEGFQKISSLGTNSPLLNKLVLPCYLAQTGSNQTFNVTQ